MRTFHVYERLRLRTIFLVMRSISSQGLINVKYANIAHFKVSGFTKRHFVFNVSTLPERSKQHTI